MKVLRVNLKDLAEMISVVVDPMYAIAVIDNWPPETPRLPVVAQNFIWIRKKGAIPTKREDLERLFSNYDVKVGKDQPIAVFHHHDFGIPYLQFKGGVEAYEFSHIETLVYGAFCHADAALISLLLSRKFHEYDKVIIVKANLSPEEMQALRSRHWVFSYQVDVNKVKEVGEEEFMIYSIALTFSGGSIILDPRRYRPELHEELTKLAFPVDQYAIPAMFKYVEIQTGVKKLDEEVAQRMQGREAEIKRELQRLKEQWEAKVVAEEELKRSRERGELPPEDAKNYVERISPSLGYDYTGEPIYPPNRKDIAVVRRMVENGCSYGYDIIYLVWKIDGEIRAKPLIDSRDSRDYIHIKSVKVTEDGISVEVYSGGSYSGTPWSKKIEVPFSQLFAEAETEEPKEVPRLSEGIAAFFGTFPTEAEPFGRALAEQMARLERAALGKKSIGQEILEEKFSEEMKSLREKHPNLSEFFRLATIAEVYEEQLVRETLLLLQTIEDHSTANLAIHILGEMAMMRNDPSLYSRLLKLLRDRTDEERQKILHDDSLEYQLDNIIEAALRKYE